MKSKKRVILPVVCTMFLQGAMAFAYDTSTDVIRTKQLEFASKYEYKEGDFDKSFKLYPGIIYTSGIEYTQEGKSYECPAIYIDQHASMVDDFNLKKGEAEFIINGSRNQYSDQCVLYNDRLLVPVSVFENVGCQVAFNPDTYVATLSKNNTILEILPNMIGMRKNQADGYYVPLEVCARFVDDVLYVPVRAVADELGLIVNYIDNPATVTLNDTVQ